MSHDVSKLKIHNKQTSLISGLDVTDSAPGDNRAETVGCSTITYSRECVSVKCCGRAQTEDEGDSEPNM
jgi:hypothetical protein